jgi:MFS family permease
MTSESLSSETLASEIEQELELTQRVDSGGSRPSLGNAVRVFQHRNYRLFFSSQLVSLIGTWMQSVAQAWLVLDLTHDPFVLGVVSAVQFLPVLIFGLFGGLIADALPKRRTLVATQVVQMGLALALFALTATGRVEVWQIVVLAFLLGLSNAVDMPTRQSFVVEMVGREDLANAVALNSATFNAARILGPAVAGLLIGATGVSIAFLINGLSFLAVIVGYLLMRDDDLRKPVGLQRPSSVREVGSSLADGLRFVRHSQIVLLPIVVVGLVSMLGMNFGVVIPALATDVLHVDATGYGFLMAATGVGSLLAALWIALLPRPRAALIGIGGVVLGVAELVAALVHALPLAMLAMVAVGFGAIAMAATANTTIQLNVPDHLRGRVVSVYTVVFVGSTPPGGLLMGAIASALGVAVALAAGGVACIAVGLGGLAWWRRIRERQVAEAAVAHVA